MGAMKDMLVTEAELWERIISHRLVRMPRDWYDYRGSLPGDTVIFDRVMANLLDPSLYGGVEIILAECSDYDGSSVDRANVRAWRDEFSTEAYEDWGAWSKSSKAWLILGIVPGADPDDAEDRITRLAAIAEALDDLDDYPLLNDEAHSELEMELAEEAWDSWLWNDIRSEVDSVIEDRWGDDWKDAPSADEYEEKLREAYYRHEDTWWTCETANSAVNDNHDRVLADVLKDVLADVYPSH